MGFTIESLVDKRIYTPGPVKMSPEILALGAIQTPYFRNRQFSELVLECESWLLALVNAPLNSRVLFLTASGTAAMEATVVNLLNANNPVTIINGGSFGQRFVDICKLHHIPIQELQVDRDTLGDGLVLSRTEASSNALLINAHETSIGHLYDLKTVGHHCRQQDLLHIVDAISLFVTDPLDMQDQNIDVLILSSHKGLALPPGLAMVILTPLALTRIRPSKNYYFDFNAYLQDGLRGQTPFTPAVSIFLQLHTRLQQLKSQGLPKEWLRVQNLASYFRQRIQGMPLTPYSSAMPNAMTALRITNGMPATQLVETLENRYRCVVAPNGGALKNLVFRVSHMGDMYIDDIDFLLKALQELLGDSV